MLFLSGWAACDGSLIFFLMSGGGGDRLGVGGWCVRDNLSDSSLFRCISKVYSFSCLKKSHKKAVNYYVIIMYEIKIMLKNGDNCLNTN